MLLLATVVDGEGPGGIPVVNGLVLDALDRAGRAATVVSLHDGPGSPSLAGRSGTGACAGSRVRFLLAALARRQGPGGAVLATHVGLAPGGRLARGRGRLAVFLHGVECWRPLPLRTRWGLHATDLFIANSAHTLARFREANPGWSRVAAEVCPLPARDLGVAPRPEGPREEAVLVVGRLWGRGLLKGQALLLRLWPEVLRRFPAARLWIAGDGEGRSALEARAQELGLADAVRFHGAVDDRELSRLYATASIYAMPGEGEGFGLVFAEAMAHGLPCIAGSRDAGGEVVAHGETGLVVDPRAEGAVLDALCALLSDPALRGRMGVAARLRAAQRFSSEGFRTRMVRILDDLAGTA